MTQQGMRIGMEAYEKVVGDYCDAIGHRLYHRVNGVNDKFLPQEIRNSIKDCRVQPALCPGRWIS